MSVSIHDNTLLSCVCTFTSVIYFYNSVHTTDNCRRNPYIIAITAYIVFVTISAYVTHILITLVHTNDLHNNFISKDNSPITTANQSPPHAIDLTKYRY